MIRVRGFRGILLILSLGLVAWAWKMSLAKTEVARVPALPAIIFVEAPAVVPGPLAQRFPRGSHLVRYTPGTPSSSAINLTLDFYAAADPQVSVDATRILFSAQKSRGARWQIWEMNADGSGKRQLTHSPDNCFQPAYLPRNAMVFTMVAGRGSQRMSAIYVLQQNGTRPHPITFGPGNFQVETVLHSGRVLVSARSLLVAGGKGDESRRLYTLRPDGSGLNPFRSDSTPDTVPTAAEELPDGAVLFVKWRDPAGRRTGGQLAWVQPGALHNSVITPPGSMYWSAHVLDGNRLVVAKANSGSSGTVGKFSLYVFNLATRSAGKPIFSDPKFSSVDAVSLEARRAPLGYPSILHPDRDYGRIVCLDAYLSAGAPHSRLQAHIARVRIIALQPDHHSQRILGEAPVESDGSFYIKVPADHPIRFELLGSNGAVVRAQKSWIWARNGEDVACLGCHENKAVVPTDHFPLALKRFDTPTPVGVPSHSLPKEH